MQLAQETSAKLAQLDYVIREIAKLDQITERSFLEVGRKVKDFHQTAEEISANALQTVQLLEGTSGEKALLRLQLLIERCSLWLNDAQSQSVQIVAVLEELVAQMACIKSPLNGLRTLIRTLQGLRISTRIETARVPGAGAQVLADKLKNLAGTIQMKVQQIEQQFETLGALSHRMLDKELRASEGPMKTAQQGIQKSRLVLSSFAEQQLEAGQRAEIVQQQSHRIATHYAEIIVALQFQDITRQRLEHIQHALEDLAGQFDTVRSHDAVEGKRGALSMAGNVCRLQHEHLEQIVADFDSAVGSLMQNLAELSVGVRGLTVETRGFDHGIVAEAAGEHETRAVLLQTITRQLELILGLHTEASDAIRTVYEQIHGISGQIDAIELIGEDMQLMAFNAAISAAHSRGKGAGLQVIAGQIQVLSESAFAETRALADACRQVITQRDGLEQLDGTGHQLADRLSDLVKEGGELLQILEGNSQKVTTQIKQLSAKTDRLGEDVSKCLKAIDIGDRFRLQVTPLLASLTELSHDTPRPGEGRDHQQEHLFRKMASRYTMHRERELHDNLIAIDSISRPTAGTGTGEAADGRNLGDNVELF